MAIDYGTQTITPYASPQAKADAGFAMRDNLGTGVINPAVVTSKTATSEIDDITKKLADITTQVNTQATKIATDKAKAEADTKAKADADIAAKAAADKLAIDKQLADAKTAATSEEPTTTDKTITGADGINYTISPDGQIVSSSGRGRYQVGSNVSQYPDLNDLFKGTTPQDKEEQAKASLAQADADYQAEAKRVSDTISNIQNGTIPLNAGQVAQIEGLKLQFQQLIDNQVLINTGASGLANVRGYQAGAAEYDANFQVKTIGAIVTAGVNKVTDLQVKMASAIAALTESFKESNIKQVKSAWEIYQDAATEHKDAVQKIVDDTQKAIAAAQAKLDKAKKDQYDQVTKPIQDIQADAAKAGADALTMAKIAAAKTVAEAMSAAGVYLQTSTNSDLQKYLEYKRGVLAKGLVPEDFDSWQTRQNKMEADKEYQKAYGAAAGKAAGEQSVVGTSNAPGIIKTILGSSKFTKDQARTITDSIANGEDPLTVVKNQAKNIMTGTNANKVESYENTKKATEALAKSLDAYYAAGGKTGIFSGNFEKIVNKLGTVSDPERVGLLTEIQTNLQIYRNAISGTAYSEQEGKDIASIFPGITKGEVLNNTIVQARIKALDALVDGIYQNTLGKGYDELKKLEPVINAPQQVDEYVRTHPDQAELVARAYEVPGATDEEVLEYIQLLEQETQ